MGIGDQEMHEMYLNEVSQTIQTSCESNNDSNTCIKEIKLPMEFDKDLSNKVLNDIASKMVFGEVNIYTYSNGQIDYVYEKDELVDYLESIKLILKTEQLSRKERKALLQCKTQILNGEIPRYTCIYDKDNQNIDSKLVLSNLIDDIYKK